MARKPTEQERDPHIRLVDARNAVQECVGCTRREAARIVNQMSHDQVQQIVDAYDQGEREMVHEIADPEGYQLGKKEQQAQQDRVKKQQAEKKQSGGNKQSSNKSN